MRDHTVEHVRELGLVHLDVVLAITLHRLWFCEADCTDGRMCENDCWDLDNVSNNF